MSLLEVNQLKKKFGDLVAVDGVSFQVGAGEVFGLLGPNGAGKSTTMMMICGLLPADSGTVKIDGQTLDIRNRNVRSALGVVPQDLAIYPDLTARENLNFFGRLYGLRGQELNKRIDEALSRIGLTNRANDRVGDYSGGMKRRLNFGAALLHKPHLLILDEPTVGVDPQSRSHLLDCVRQLNSEGVAAIYASHYMEEVQALCHRVGIVDRGKMIACDTLESLLGRMSSDLRLNIARPANGLVDKLKGLAEIDTTPEDGATIIISRDQHHDHDKLNATLSRVLEILTQSHVELKSVETHEPNLERLFLKLTGSRLRD